MKKTLNKARENKEYLPRLITKTLLGFLLVSILFVAIIDVFNLFGLRDTVESLFYVPYFWYIWFVVLGVVEILQWFILGAAVFVFCVGAGMYYKQKNTTSIFYFMSFMGAGLILMLIEDTGNVRHIIRSHMHYLSGGRIVGNYGYLVTLLELVYFGIIAGIILFGVIRFRDAYWDKIQTRRYLVLGVLFYAVAVTSSWLGHAFRGALDDFKGLYVEAGNIVVQAIFTIDDAAKTALENATERMYVVSGHDLPFAFMDNVYEESLEFIGATFLLAAGISLFVHAKDSNKPDRIEVLGVDK